VKQRGAEKLLSSRNKVRVVTRLAQKVPAAAGDIGTTIRDRTRSIKKRVLQIAKVLRFS
jgi:IS5 family transposase